MPQTDTQIQFKFIAPFLLRRGLKQAFDNEIATEKQQMMVIGFAIHCHSTARIFRDPDSSVTEG